MPQLDQTLRQVEIRPAATPLPSPNPQDPETQLTPLSKTQILENIQGPIANIDLTPEEAIRIRQAIESRLILGVADAVVMVCAETCPVAHTCPFHQIGKAPYGLRCPVEQMHARTRFAYWLDQLSRDLETLLESERATIANLVALDIQDHRCHNIMAQSSQANMVSRSVRDVDTNGNVICWEDVVHINKQILDANETRRRMLLKDWELTPEAITRKRKSEGDMGGGDLSSRSSEKLDRLRAAQRRTIDVPLLPA